MKTLPQMYEATDGRQFDDEQEAARHQIMIDARSAYERARLDYAKALAETCRTADGHPFELNSSRSYYHVRRGPGGIPETAAVSFWYWDIDLSEGGNMFITVDEGSGRGRVTYNINSLFVSRDKAREAWRATMAKFIKDLTHTLETAK